ncbi:MAG TPA: type 1 glutamine amidotransferase, partial [Burkholderiales bacterium]|nr:type 1 glutamine amidotransferase [Burkholderiales bacterium]
MKPVAIFRHSPTEGPGYFATFLDAHSVPWRLVKVDAGERVPADARAFSGLVFMGGPMSVNDDLPWIREVLGLINSAAQADIPLLGHCLGGQLMSKALGGKVTRNPVKEIGW